MQDLTAFKVEEGRGMEDGGEVLLQVQEPVLRLTDGGLQSGGGASTWSWVDWMVTLTALAETSPFLPNCLDKALSLEDTEGGTG